jgi:2,3-dihydroxybenzoate-AMP ligase
LHFPVVGRTTGIPKLIPRTHNDYAFNSKTAAPVCAVTQDSVLLLALPIAHNLPLACPGIQGYFFQGGKVVLSPTTKPEELFTLMQKHKVTHLKVVALPVDPADHRSGNLEIRFVVAETDSKRRPAHAAGGEAEDPSTHPVCFVQENFGMSEGMLFFVRLDDPQEVKLETCGRPMLRRR